MVDKDNAEQVNDHAANDYKLSVNDDGVYLVVFTRNETSAPLSEPVILDEMRKHGFQDINYSLIIKTIREAAGQPVKVAMPPLVPDEPEIRIVVTRDYMQATLQILITKKTRPLLPKEVEDKLADEGIIYGIDQVAIQNAFRRPGMQVVCARGLPAVKGQDAYISYEVDLENSGRPEELAGGRVDFKNLNTYIMVAEQQVIAKKFPPTAGSPGRDIFGKVVPAKPGKDIAWPIGQNVEITSDNQMVAAIAGHIIVQNKRICVIPAIEVDGDVDLSTGNINFSGNVIVHGSVQVGMSVIASGSIEIMGTVYGGIVEGKNVIVRMGIKGMNRGHIRAEGSVITKFIENAIVDAGDEIKVSEVILQSQTTAGKRVIVEGRHGSIIGGRTSAGEEIRAKTAGSHLAANTDLEVGINPALRDEYAMLRQATKENNSLLDKTQKALNILRANQANLSPERQEMLLNLTKSQFMLMGQAETMRKRLQELESSFEKIRNGRIRIADTAFPGVKIVVSTIVMPIRDIVRCCSFLAENGEIKIGSY